MRTLIRCSLTLAVICWSTMSTGMGQEADACPPDLTGKWSGCWESICTGHHGPLHAKFCKVDDCHYRVRFHGRFFKIVPFMYSVTLNVTGQAGDKVLLAGESRVPLFGTFHYHAEADACHFDATYSSCKDHGKFTLSRKPGCCE